MGGPYPMFRITCAGGAAVGSTGAHGLGDVVVGVVLGAVVVGVVVGADVGLDDGGVALGDDVGVDGDWLCTTGDGWWPRAGVTGLGDTARWPAGARRIEARTTVPATAASPAAVTVAGWVPNRLNSVRRRSASSGGRLARWAPRLLTGAATNAAVGQMSSSAVT